MKCYIIIMQPAAQIMDDLQYIADELRNATRYVEAQDVEILVEVANRSGHTHYTFDLIATEVRKAIPDEMSADVVELIEAATSH